MILNVIESFFIVILHSILIYQYLVLLQSSKAYDPSTICIPQRDFAIGIAIAGLLLIVAVIAAILILLTKRRRRKDLSTTGSSIYSGPYTNTAYSYSS